NFTLPTWIASAVSTTVNPRADASDLTPSPTSSWNVVDSIGPTLAFQSTSSDCVDPSGHFDATANCAGTSLPFSRRRACATSVIAPRGIDAVACAGKP